MSRPPHTRRWHALRPWVEPWYLAYAVLGATVAGVAPILLPVAVSRTGRATDVGLVIAALSLGGLLAPLWGSLAERYRLHRWLLAGGLLVTASGLAAFPFATSRLAWVGLALLQGIGAAGAGTVATLLVVQAHPEAEWHQRIAWLQTFYDSGTVGGLVLVAGLSQADLQVVLPAAAGVTALAAGLGWWTSPAAPGRLIPKPILRAPARHGEWALCAPQRMALYGCFTDLRRLGAALRSPFGLLLAAWLFILLGTAAFFALYPVLMQQEFGIGVGRSSSVLALAMGLELLLYAPAGHWANRFGPVRLMQAALAVRLLAFVSLFGLGLAHGGGQSRLPLLGLLLAVLPWPLFSVSSTALAVRLSPLGEGIGLGLFNAATGLAAVSGALLGGWLAARWGYTAASGAAVVGLALGLGLTLCIRPVQGE